MYRILGTLRLPAQTGVVVQDGLRVHYVLKHDFIVANVHTGARPVPVWAKVKRVHRCAASTDANSSSTFAGRPRFGAGMAAFGPIT